MDEVTCGVDKLINSLVLMIRGIQMLSARLEFFDSCEL